MSTRSQEPLIDFLVSIARVNCRPMETRGNELWDADAPYNDDMPPIEQRWNLLKQWPLDQCDFKTNTEGNEAEFPYFVITHKNQPEQPLILSNRDSRNNELRGPRLITALKERQETHPRESIYQAMQSIAVSNFSMLNKYKELAVTQEKLDENPATTGSQAMSKMHYAIFTAALQNKILKGQDFNPLELYEGTKKIERVEQQISLIEQKKDKLNHRKEHAAVDLLDKLTAQLDLEKQHLLAGKINVEAFVQHCEKHINNIVAHPDLSGHRLSRGKLYEKVSKAININPEPTDTIKKIKNLKDSLNDLRATNPDSAVNSKKLKEEPPTLKMR